MIRETQIEKRTVKPKSIDREQRTEHQENRLQIPLRIWPVTISDITVLELK